MGNLITEIPTEDFTGRVLTLNLEKTSRYQCGGFLVTSRNPTAIVQPHARMTQLQNALLQGILLEISSKDGSIQGKHSRITGAQELGETDHTVFPMIRKGPDGNPQVFFLMPDSPEQAKQIEEEIQNTGKLDLSRYPNVEKMDSPDANVQPMGLTAIEVTDIEPSEELNEE